MFIIFFIIGFLSVFTQFVKIKAQNPLPIQEEDINKCASKETVSEQTACYISLSSKTRNKTVCKYIDENYKDACYKMAGI